MESFLPGIVFSFCGAVMLFSRPSGPYHQPKARRWSIASGLAEPQVASSDRCTHLSQCSRLPRLTLFIWRKQAYKHERQNILLATLS
jgi:hypothetical protein